ncbi:MAG: type II toxin-antitoxin system death-on-curing family toxin [Verrucomicrobia bacterium]|jgi:death-on-curing protein|nr:type II toxin-antitoxin system death-on-curing family toxin [Verrucomicrobiota bacterium]
MNEPNWVDRQVLIAIQSELLNRFGGLAGIRDEGLLDSAINKPKNLIAYGQPTVFELAASYATGLVKNHPFLDGNKRIGFMAAYVFLGANGWSLEATEEEAVLETLELAAGERTEADYAAWLARNSVES